MRVPLGPQTSPQQPRSAERTPELREGRLGQGHTARLEHMSPEGHHQPQLVLEGVVGVEEGFPVGPRRPAACQVLHVLGPAADVEGFLWGHWGRGVQGLRVWTGRGQGEGGVAGCPLGPPPWSGRRMDRADVGRTTCMALLRMVLGGWWSPGSHSHPSGLYLSTYASIPIVQPQTRGPMIHAPLQREMLPPRATPRCPGGPLTANIEAGAG